jgi:OpgC protein
MAGHRSSSRSANHRDVMRLNLSRLHFIDFARTFAVVLALLAHSLNNTKVFDRMGADSVYIKQFTRTATPIFVFMFGFMIEFVYATRARASGVASIQRRLRVRSFQCYFGYCLTSFCTLLGGQQSLYKFAASLTFFFGNSRFGNILRVYAVIMLFTPLLVRLRLRYGVRFVVFCLTGVLLSFPFVIQLKGVDFGVFNNPLHMLFGVGLGWGGPSVWHSMSFVLSGMLLASSLTGGAKTLRNAFSRFYLIALGLVSICAVAWFPLVHDSPAEAWVKFADFTYRGSNMPGYYLIGIVTSVFWITLFSLLIGTRELSRPVKFFLPLGLSSLFSYTTGNVLLNLSGYVATRVNPTLYTAVFFVSVLIITKYIDRMPYYEYANELMCLRFPRRAHAEASLPAGARPRSE